MTTFTAGDDVAARRLTALDGTAVAVPDPEHLVHLQFRRFAGCPICHLHLRSIAAHNADLRAAGVIEVVVFHSAATCFASTSPACPSR